MNTKPNVAKTKLDQAINAFLPVRYVEFKPDVRMVGRIIYKGRSLGKTECLSSFFKYTSELLYG